jgi:glycosyltransferase involved in cell wall biosynthesis
LPPAKLNLLLVTNAETRSSISIYARAVSLAVGDQFRVSVFDGQSFASGTSFQARWEQQGLLSSGIPAASITYWWRYRRALSKHASEFDIIHVCSQRFAFVATFLAKRGSKLILTVHDLFPQSLEALDLNLFSMYYSTLALRVRHWFFWRSMKRAAAANIRIITDSQVVREEVCRLLNYQSGLIDVIPIPVSPRLPKMGRGTARERMGIPRDAKVVLSVSSDEPRKNLSLLYRVLRDMPRDTHLIRLGPLDYRQVDPGQIPRIHHFNRMEEVDVLGSYEASDLLVFPSLAEGFGLPLAEAMAYGVAIVATDIPSTRELVEDAAILVDPVRPERFVAAVLEVLANAALRDTLIRKGRQRAGLFDSRTIGPRFLRAYASLAPRPAASPNQQ